MSIQLIRNGTLSDISVGFLPNLSAIMPEGSDDTRAPTANIDPTIPHSVSVKRKLSVAMVMFVSFFGISSCGITGEVQESTVPEHIAPSETEN